MSRAAKLQPAKLAEQGKKFTNAALELGCDEDEAAFDAKLKKVAAHKPGASAQHPPERQDDRRKPEDEQH
jgi:hypothetical protein